MSAEIPTSVPPKENAVKSRVSSILSSVLKKAVSTISKDIRIIAKGDPLPIFSWGKKN